MKESSLYRLALVSLVATMVFGLWSVAMRHRVEARNNAVSIALEIETIESAASGSGASLDDAITQLKAKGLGTVVVSEDLLSDYLGAGQASISSPTTIKAGPGLAGRIARGVRLRFPGATCLLVPSGVQLGGQIPSAAAMRTVSLGLDPGVAAAVRRHGLLLIGRMANPPEVGTTYVQGMLDDLIAEGAEVFLPVGDQVLGRRDATEPLLDALAAGKLFYASPEFAKIGGDQEVVEKAPEAVIRLHSAQAAELDKLPMSEVVDRYSKAARERKQRILLVRPVSFASDNPVDSLGATLDQIAAGVVRDGCELGAPHPMEDSHVPTWLFVLIGLAACPMVALAGAVLIPRWSAWWLAAALVFAIACASGMGRTVDALLISLALPFAGFLLMERAKPKNWLVAFVIVSVVSFAGGVAIAGLLNGLPYFIQAKQFMGVKLSIFLPVLLVGWYFYTRVGAGWKGLKSGVSWVQLATGFVILAVIGFLIVRTGNDNPAAVSTWELKFRAVLDALLFVRPRTKEFLFGHPMLVIGLAMYVAYKRKPIDANRGGFVALALMVGAIGQTGMVNTMCHIHTPVLLDIERVGMGLVAGVILGAIVLAIVGQRLLRWVGGA